MSLFRDNPDRDPPYSSLARVAAALAGAAVAAAVFWRLINRTHRPAPTGHIFFAPARIDVDPATMERIEWRALNRLNEPEPKHVMLGDGWVDIGYTVPEGKAS